MKNAYLAPEAEFLCVSAATDILALSEEYGAGVPASINEEV